MVIIEMLKSAVYGIIQGITEWLPISSTGHLILVNEFMALNVSASFWEMFRVVIQLASILAVIVLYFRPLNPFSPSKTPGQKSETISLWGKIIVGCVPAGIVGLLFEDDIDALFYNYQTVALALIVYGVLFLLLERRNANAHPRIESISQISYRSALFIGIFQVLSLVPGTSRSGSTILPAVFLGASRTVAAEFSFFLAIPVMCGASFLKLFKFGFDFSGLEWGVLLTGFIVSFAVSLFAVRFLIGYIRKHDFKVFGYYRIALGVILVLFFLLAGK